MRYIRTKDGHIYEIDECGNFVGYQGLWNPNNKLVWWQMETKDKYHVDAPNGYTVCIKQADTIEELCDEFVGIIEEDGERFVFSNTKENELFVKEQNRYHAYEVLYGAIWTDKGLIYVAKMNEKGELELL